jgi:TRAP-type C4-dicarboxylate transport system permease small subunit
MSVTTNGSERSSRHTLVVRALRLFDCIIDLGAVLAAVTLIGVMVATTVKVIFRYGLHVSFIGVDQISGTLLLYIAFLGAAWVLRRDEHVTIDLVLAHVGGRTRWFLMVTSSLIGTAVCLVLTVFGTIEVVTSLHRGIRIPAEIEIPRAVNLIVIPIGFLCLTLQFLRRALDEIKGIEMRPPSSRSSV